MTRTQSSGAADALEAMGVRTAPRAVEQPKVVEQPPMVRRAKRREIHRIGMSVAEYLLNILAAVHLIIAPLFIVGGIAQKSSEGFIYITIGLGSGVTAVIYIAAAKALEYLRRITDRTENPPD